MSLISLFIYIYINITYKCTTILVILYLCDWFNFVGRHTTGTLADARQLKKKYPSQYHHDLVFFFLI